MKNENDNSDLAVSDRRAWVLKQYLLGRLPDAVYQDWQKTYTGLSKASFQMDVVKAYEQLRLHSERNNEAVIERHTDYLYDMYEEARQSGRLDSAVKILKEIRETLSIGGVKKPTTAIQVNQNNLQLPAMSVEEIRSLLANNQTEESSVLVQRKSNDTQNNLL